MVECANVCAQSMTNKFRVYEELPEGWASADTPEGKRYYFNVVTQHTQWEKPSENSRTFLPLELARHFTPEEVRTWIVQEHVKH